jgi:integrase
MTEEPGLTDNGVHCHFPDLRVLFNNIKNHYNDEDLGLVIVKHYPFKKYKVKRYKPRRKKKLTIAQVCSIRDLIVPRNTRIEQAKELFMLSFYLCGMNAVDLHKLEATENAPKRVEYFRSKTTGRRTDEAFISIKLIKESKALYLKYAGLLTKRYGNYRSLNQAVAYGMRAIGKKLRISELEFYDARHAFADIARNKCRFSVDDIALALNHIDEENTLLTYIYQRIGRLSMRYKQRF